MSTFRLEDYPKLIWAPTKDQEVSIERLPSSKGFIVADVTGKGKTYSALASFAVMEKHNPDAHLLVLATKSAVASWRSDISEATRFRFREFTSSTPPEDDEIRQISYEISVITYTSFEKFSGYLTRLVNEKYVVVVSDEFHRAANPKSQVGKVVRYIRQYVPYFWGLTATPLGNHLESLYDLVSIVKPGLLGGTWWGFLRRFCAYKKTKKSQGRTQVTIEGIYTHRKEELREKLRSVMLRRDLVDVRVEFHRRTCELTEREERMYLVAAAGEMGRGLRESAKKFSARLPDLQLVVNNTANSLKEYNDNYDDLGTKEMDLLDLCRAVLHRKKEPMVVFTSSRDTQRRLLEVCLQNLMFSRLLQINGDSSEDERDHVSKTFGGTDLLIMSPAGGESLNLQASGNLAFYDLPFDLRQFVQAAGRVVRMNTEHDPVNIWILEALGTIDSYKSVMIFRNAQLFEAVMKGTKTLPTREGKISADLLRKMRQQLLWRARELSARDRARSDG